MATDRLKALSDAKRTGITAKPAEETGIEAIPEAAAGDVAVFTGATVIIPPDAAEALVDHPPEAAPKEKKTREKKFKQCIVMRKDLKLRRGKEISQGAHASLSFITRRLEMDTTGHNKSWLSGQFSEAEIQWMQGNFRKICVQVSSEPELLEVYEKAKAAGLEAHLITDSGLTEFHGVPTRTCIAVGPDEDEKIDAITSQLKLY